MGARLPEPFVLCLMLRLLKESSRSFPRVPTPARRHSRQFHHSHFARRQPSGHGAGQKRRQTRSTNTTAIPGPLRPAALRGPPLADTDAAPRVAACSEPPRKAADLWLTAGRQTLAK